MQYLGRITGDLHSSGRKIKKVVMNLFVKQEVCLCAGIAKLIFTMHRLAKITSATRNTHEIVWKARIPDGRGHI